jgi:hypothetical protein
VAPRLSSASSISPASTVSFYANIPNPLVHVTATITNAANNRSVTAKVADRFFIAEDVPLEVGENRRPRSGIVATDHVGNTREQTLQVSCVSTGSHRITMLADNRQRGGTKSDLPRTLKIAALDQYGNPLANMPITFDVLRDTGSLANTIGGTTACSGGTAADPTTALSKRNLIISTDAGGRAKVYLTLGKQAGEAGNMMRARNPSVNEEMVFSNSTHSSFYCIINSRAATPANSNIFAC